MVFEMKPVCSLAMLPVKRTQPEWVGVDWFGMAVTVEMQNADDPQMRAEVVAMTGDGLQ